MGCGSVGGKVGKSGGGDGRFEGICEGKGVGPREGIVDGNGTG